MFPLDTTPLILSILEGVAVPEASTRSMVRVIAVSVGKPVTVAGVIVSEVPVPIPVERVVEKRLLYFFSLSLIEAGIVRFSNVTEGWY